MAVGLINEAVEQSDASNTLKSLQLPTAKLQNVTPENQSHYQALLHRCKQEKAKVGRVFEMHHVSLKICTGKVPPNTGCDDEGKEKGEEQPHRMGHGQHLNLKCILTRFCSVLFCFVYINIF